MEGGPQAAGAGPGIRRAPKRQPAAAVSGIEKQVAEILEEDLGNWRTVNLDDGFFESGGDSSGRHGGGQDQGSLWLRDRHHQTCSNTRPSGRIAQISPGQDWMRPPMRAPERHRCWGGNDRPRSRGSGRSANYPDTTIQRGDHRHLLPLPGAEDHRSSGTTCLGEEASRCFGRRAARAGRARGDHRASADTCRCAATIAGKDLFDAEFFKMTPQGCAR